MPPAVPGAHLGRSTTTVATSDGSLPIDTLGVLRTFEDVGMSREQAEAMTIKMTEMILSTISSHSSTFASKLDLERATTRQTMDLEKTSAKHDTDLITFKGEIAKMEELKIQGILKDVELIKNDLAKYRTEIR